MCLGVVLFMAINPVRNFRVSQRTTERLGLISNGVRRIECKITGRVQMVMFRDFANRHARKLGLTGWVQNISDGAVAITAEGSEQHLQEFIQRLWRGPLLARVEDVMVSWKDGTGEFEDFHIVY